MLDYLLAETTYGPRQDHFAQWATERTAEYFAACLLMPRTPIKRAFFDEGIQGGIGS